MKTIAVENTVYAKLLKLKSTVNRIRGTSVTFSKLLEEAIRRPLGPLLIDSTLMAAVRHLIEQLSQHNSIHGVILFGSVAKGMCHAYSDVDLFILAERTDSETFDYVEKSARRTEIEFFDRLAGNKLPAYFAPFMCSLEEVGFLRPIFFDIADSGIILFDRNLVASDFVDRYTSLPHSRKFTENGEVLTW
ncbi:MAG: hypothetical protein B2I17_01900 [Thermoplasmatales archaeon B_DKE]|nr:MAG: hypothetical protein B2I17_01900 [Thermoplasmatales archaeon B_DKE]